MTADLSSTVPPAPPARRDPLAALRRTGTVRLRCAAVTQSIADGRSGAFRLAGDAVQRLCDRLFEAAADPSPAPAPVTGGDRWVLLRADGIDRLAGWSRTLADRPPASALAARLDLAVLLALLDAESATVFRHDEAPEGADAVDRLALPVERQANADLFAMLDRFAPSTGSASAPAPASDPSPLRGEPARHRHVGPVALSIAAWGAFGAGVFSSSRDDPWRVDAGALRQLDAAGLRAALRIDATHPWPAVDARAAALARLGRWLAEAPDGGAGRRLSDLVQLAIAQVGGDTPGTVVDAPALVAPLARLLAPGVAGGLGVLGLPAGDVAAHPWAGAAAGGDAAAAPAPDPATGGWVPFHRTTQTLVRTLREPLATAGLTLSGLDRLPDASADRHIAALLDAGALCPRAAADLARPRRLTDLLAVEARAAAVTLWDRALEQARRQWRGDQPAPDADVWVELATRPRRDGRPAFEVASDDPGW
jgi:hypothetical protein